MTDHRRPSWETLNAFVDGELSAEESRQIEQLLFNDEHIAYDVEQLRRMKSLVSSTASAQAKAFYIPQREHKRSMIPWISALAATVLVGVLLWQSFLLKPVVPGFAQDAYAAHTLWLVQLESDVVYSGGWVKTGVTTTGMFIPELSEMSLSLSYVDTVSIDQRQGMHIGYIGPKGCAISLISWPAENSQLQALATLGEGENQAYAWQADGWHYMVLASQMPVARRAVTAHILYDITTKKRLPSPLDQQQYIASREANSPCQV